MMCHYLDLVSASDWSCHGGNPFQPMKSATSILVVTSRQYGISAVVSRKSFPGETSSATAKCRRISNPVHIIENVSEVSGLRTSTWLSEVVFSFLIPDSSRLSRDKETRSAEKKKTLMQYLPSSVKPRAQCI